MLLKKIVRWIAFRLVIRVVDIAGKETRGKDIKDKPNK